MITFRSPENIDEVLKYSDWLKKSHRVPFHIMLGKICLGEYRALLVGDPETFGIIVFRPMDNLTTCFIIWAYFEPGRCRGNCEEFFIFIRNAGYKKVLAESVRGEKGFVETTGLKKLYSVYGRDL